MVKHTQTIRRQFAFSLGLEEKLSYYLFIMYYLCVINVVIVFYKCFEFVAKQQICFVSFTMISSQNEHSFL